MHCDFLLRSARLLWVGVILAPPIFSNILFAFFYFLLILCFFTHTHTNVCVRACVHGRARAWLCGIPTLYCAEYPRRWACGAVLLGLCAARRTSRCRMVEARMVSKWWDFDDDWRQPIPRVNNNHPASSQSAIDSTRTYCTSKDRYYHSWFLFLFFLFPSHWY